MPSMAEEDAFLLPAGHCDFNFGGRYRGVDRIEVAYGRHVRESGYL